MKESTEQEFKGLGRLSSNPSELAHELEESGNAYELVMGIGGVIGALIGAGISANPDISINALHAIGGGFAIGALPGAIGAGVEEIKIRFKHAIQFVKTKISEIEYKRLEANEEKLWDKLEKAIEARESHKLAKPSATVNKDDVERM